MRGWPHLVLLVSMLGAPALAQTGGSPPSTGATMVSDIDPQSGMRLPLPRREDLDEVGKRMYDRGTTPGATIAGLQGPAGIQLYATRAAGYLQPLNRYLRFESGISPRIREIAILTTAREMDRQFEWVAHEPEALKEGVPPEVIDVIKHRRPTEGLDAADAVVIELGRQIWRDHKVTSPTFAKAIDNLGDVVAYLDQPDFAKFWDEDAKRVEAAVKSIGKVAG